MINTTLRKCLVELEKAEPNISYVRGMIETLIEMQQQTGNSPLVTTLNHPSIGNILPPPQYITTSSTDEASILDMRAKEAIATARELEKNGTISTEQP